VTIIGSKLAKLNWNSLLDIALNLLRPLPIKYLYVLLDPNVGFSIHEREQVSQ